MDIEEDIKALQLDSSEDTVLVNVEDARPGEAIKHDKVDGEDSFMEEERKTDDVGKPDMPEDELRDEAHPDLKPEHVDPKGVSGKESSPPEDMQVEVEVNKKRHLNVVFIGHVVKLDEYKSPKYQEGKLGKQNNMVNEEITIGTM